MTLKQYKSNVLPLKDKFYRYALSIVHEIELSEDIVQEVLMKIWEQRKKMAGIQNIESWGIRMTRNLAIDKLRKKKRSRLTLAGDTIHTMNVGTMDHTTEYRDLMKAISDILNRMPEKQREVFRLREIMGYRNIDIQETLGLSETDVKVSLFRARKKVKSQLEKLMNYGLENS